MEPTKVLKGDYDGRVARLLSLPDGLELPVPFDHSSDPRTSLGYARDQFIFDDSSTAEEVGRELLARLKAKGVRGRMLFDVHAWYPSKSAESVT